MADDPLDLLRELETLCNQAGSDMDSVIWRIHAIQERLKQPILPRKAESFGHRVYEVHREEYYLAALAKNLDVAKAAFDALVKIYPHREWKVRWGGFTPAHYIPPEGLVYDPVPPRMID